VNLDLARSVADAVLYEGYLLYPYRASSSKNQARWQFGVLGPPGAAEAGIGEESSMTMQCLVEPRRDPLPGGPAARPDPEVVVHLRFLQLQRRQVYDAQGRPVEQLGSGGPTWLSWDEASEQEVTVALGVRELRDGVISAVGIPGGEKSEPLTDPHGAVLGRLVRRRWPLSGRLTATAVPDGNYLRLTLRVDNDGERVSRAASPGVGQPDRDSLDGAPLPQVPLDKDEAIRTSLIGAHLLVEAHGMAFVSLLEPPPQAELAVTRCAQHRCWPVLTGAPGDTDLVLGSPIILYDYPAIATQSAGPLFDATEIDEILTLRVMTMTEEEKAEARATDPRAREIIDRCDAMAPETLQQLHGVLRNPHAEEALGLTQSSPSVPAQDMPAQDMPAQDMPAQDMPAQAVPWWDPAADEAVQPERDVVVIDGISVAKGSLVRIHPQRRADAQDLFLAGQVARVTAVLSDVDGGVHVALVLVDDPAADLHEWYGRYLYFGPDELEPLPAELIAATPQQNLRKESRS
jgi:hypothetical protein